MNDGLSSAEPISSLLHHINLSFRPGAEAIKAIEQSFERVVLTKGKLLASEGRICHRLYFLESGLLRGFYFLDGKEITHWFAFEGDFVTSFHSFISGQPAVENIELLEGSVLWTIEKQELHKLLDQYHDIERLVRLTYETYYLRLEERFVNSQFRSASERYQDLITSNPSLLQRVPLGYIASFLGISQETLSRIRARL